MGMGKAVLTIVKNRLNLINMRRRPRNPINPLHLQPKQINSLYTLIHHHRDRRLVALEQLLQVHPEDRFQRGQVTRVHRCWSALLLLWRPVLLLLVLLVLWRSLLVRRRVLLEWMRLWSWCLEGEGLELGWSAGGAVGWCGGGSSIAHATGGSVIAGLRTPLAEAALVLLVLLRLLLLGGGWWWATLVEAGASCAQWGLVGWGAGGGGAGGALTGREGVEALGDLGLSLCCCCYWGSRWCHDLCCEY